MALPLQFSVLVLRNVLSSLNIHQITVSDRECMTMNSTGDCSDGPYDEAVLRYFVSEGFQFGLR